MHLYLPTTQNYRSKSQRIRVTSEPWLRENAFCPNCGATPLCAFENNRKVADFYCAACRCEYELKSKSGNLGRKINDGAYSTMIERIESTNNPSFFFLTYDSQTRAVGNLLVIPSFFFTSTIIERRKPLSPTARRAGWVGCNILMDKLPLAGRIYYVKAGVEQSKNLVRDTWDKTKFLQNTKTPKRGWLLDVLECLEMLGESEFTLRQVYAYEEYLQARHPENHNVRAKIRQQLQQLRDAGYLRFQGSGVYRLV